MNADIEIQQYGLGMILFVWGLATVPMALLNWVLIPKLAPSTSQGFEKLAILTIGLVWQFVLVMVFLRRETDSLGWPSIQRLLWLNMPASPLNGGSHDLCLWWWLVPFFALSAVFELKVGGALDRVS